MNINIYGSTGVIGKKTLDLINKNFFNIKVNLLCAKSNINLLKKQIYKYKPKYAFIEDFEKFKISKAKIGKTRFLNYSELLSYLSNSKSDLSILAISGYKSLYFLDHIIKNTKYLGIANKECIVSAGHIFKSRNYFKKTNIFPLDSEHFSLFEFFEKIKNNKSFNKVIITASGGPFYKKNFNDLKNIKFEQAIKHPKWKMGYKNSIDSATLVNKCLEIIEAHYLFQIPYNKINVLIHPEALVHSIIQCPNYVTHFNIFNNDMKIPIINFFLYAKLKSININNNHSFTNFSHFNFYEVNNKVFPIYKLFNNLDKDRPQNLIKFNIGNEFAVNLFKNNMIRYTDIYKIIEKVISLNLNSPLNTIKDIINYHEEIEIRLQNIKKTIN